MKGQTHSVGTVRWQKPPGMFSRILRDETAGPDVSD